MAENPFHRMSQNDQYMSISVNNSFGKYKLENSMTTWEPLNECFLYFILVSCTDICQYIQIWFEWAGNDGHLYMKPRSCFCMPLEH